jgi:hypothetical protein
MASPRQQRMPLNPLQDVPGPEPRTDPRHDRRALSLEELRRLLDTARASAWTWRGLTGEDRYHLYLTACATGYRRGELSSLTPRSFDLKSDPPTATLPGKKTKNKRLAVQPLQSDDAEAIALYIEGRPKDVPVWPPLKGFTEALRRDLAAAGIPYTIDGPEGPLYADFHALRHSYVALLDASGVSVKQAMSLARHSDPRLTLARYGKPQLGDLKSAVERLPSLSRADKTAGAVPAAMLPTGTEGKLSTSEVESGAQNGHPLAIVPVHQVTPGDDSPHGEGAIVTPLRAREMCSPDGLCGPLIPFDRKAEKERTPGDRRRASLLLGEELVPKV